MVDLFSSSDNLGRLDCGCRISLVVSVERPYGAIRWCELHARAEQLAGDAAELLSSLEDRFLRTGCNAREQAAVRSLSFQLGKALPKKVVKVKGPGREVLR